MSLAPAVRPGVSLPEHARDLVRIHHAFLDGRPPPQRPRAVVARSWRRVIGFGVDPGGSTLRDPAPADVVQRRRRSSPLNAVIGELTQIIGGVADASQMLLVVTDSDGVILWREGPSSVRRVADRLGFAEGAEWTEARVGTNAIGTALAEAAPVELFSAEHFEQAQHPWYCTATPIHDPRSGRLLGIIDVSGPAFTLHPAVGALVETASRLAELRLWRRHEEQLARIRQDVAPLLARTSGPVVVVDDEGWVADSRGIAGCTRVAAPAGDQLLTVPGVGLCLPERLPRGWLVRPPDPARPLKVDLRLQLDGEPTLEVLAGDAGWRRALTTRHAEIILLLHLAGPDGISAEGLSRALYGDTAHVVTARAEVSRLRRAVGALVETRPYRLAPGIRLTPSHESVATLAGCRFVRVVAGPGVRAAVAASLHG